MRLSPLILEQKFETLTLEQCERHLVDDVTLRQLEILKKAENQEHQQVLAELEKLYESETETSVQLFCIQWGVAASEVIFDQGHRQRWFGRWNNLNHCFNDPWAQYLHRFQRAVKAYFDESLTEAERLFKQNIELAKSMNYPRGIVRSQFHLGLIYRSWGQLDGARVAWEQALTAAQEHSLFRSEQNLRQYLRSLQDVVQSDVMPIREVELLLQAQKYKAARKYILWACRVRRYEHRTWGAESENAAMALFAYAKRNERRFKFLQATIRDQLIEEQVLRAADALRPLGLEAKHRLEYLQELSGYRKILQAPDRSSVTIGNRTVTLAEDREVTRLLHALFENPNGVDKENLCAAVWDHSYDPLYHDPKLYRVIHRARKLMGDPGVILNKYGIYVLAPHQAQVYRSASAESSKL